MLQMCESLRHVEQEMYLLWMIRLKISCLELVSLTRKISLLSVGKELSNWRKMIARGTD